MEGGVGQDVDQGFTVDFKFPVYFTQNIFSVQNSIFSDAVRRLEPDKRHRVLFIIDENVIQSHPDLLSSLERYFSSNPEFLELISPPIPVPGGESVKNDFKHVLRLAEEISERGVDRQSFLAVIGGGAVLDMACFVSAICHRGIRTIRIPTTVLSQADSGVGVKNGINGFGKKNFFGTFVPPFAVINDSLFIDTLSHRDKLAGLAEAVKVALIRDREFFGYIEQNAALLATADRDAMNYHIRRTAELHLQHIRTSGDPFEFGSARPLDFGHWVAHKMESMTEHSLRHGEAVAIGVAVDSVYSMRMGFLQAAETERILCLLEHLGFTLWHDALLASDNHGKCIVLKGLDEFREHLGGTLHITLLRNIGDGFEVQEMNSGVVLDSIRWLGKRFEGAMANLPDRSAVALK